jgi:hypothetical protein
VEFNLRDGVMLIDQLATIYRLCFGGTVYHIWRHSNDLLHGNLLRSEETLIGASSEEGRTVKTASSLFGQED